MSNYFKNIILLVLALVSGIINAQNIQIKSSLDTNMILIGEQATLSVDLQYPKGANVHFPILQDTIVEEIEVLNLSLDTIADANLEHYILKYTLTSFDSGYYAIPPQIIINQETGDTIQSKPLGFAVNTYKIDSASQGKFFDIKEPYQAAWTFKEFWEEYYPFMLMALLLIALILAVLWYLKKRKKVEKPVAKKVVPKEAAHLIAIRELNELKEKKLWQSDRTKLYYVELSDIVRTYLENRFKITALEQTSHEILVTIQNGQQLDKSQQGQLKQILLTADMAKFAKAKPLANENDLALKNAFELIDDTKLTETKKTEEEDASSQDSELVEEQTIEGIKESNKDKKEEVKDA